MTEIYYFTLSVLFALGMFITGVYWRRLTSFFKRYFTRNKRTTMYKWGNHHLELEQVIDLIEKRIHLLENQNAAFHGRMDELDDQFHKKEINRTSKVKQIVLEYLKSLQK